MAVRSVAVWLEEIMTAIERSRAIQNPITTYRSLYKMQSLLTQLKETLKKFGSIEKCLQTAARSENQQYTGNHFFPEPDQPCLL